MATRYIAEWIEDMPSEDPAEAVIGTKEFQTFAAADSHADKMARKCGACYPWHAVTEEVFDRFAPIGLEWRETRRWVEAEEVPL